MKPLKTEVRKYRGTDIPTRKELANNLRFDPLGPKLLKLKSDEELIVWVPEGDDEDDYKEPPYSFANSLRSYLKRKYPAYRVRHSAKANYVRVGLKIEDWPVRKSKSAGV